MRFHIFIRIVSKRKILVFIWGPVIVSAQLLSDLTSEQPERDLHLSNKYRRVTLT